MQDFSTEGGTTKGRVLVLGPFGKVVTAIFLILFVLGVWFLSSSKGIKMLSDSIYLQFKGTKIDGTVTDLEVFDDGDPIMPVHSYKLFVSYTVDGKMYTIKSRAFYKDGGMQGTSISVVYDSADPNTAMIDNFEERWLIPIGEAAP